MLPHLYIEQSPLTVPAPLRGEIKRPDYLVGIPGVGLVAFDVKAKTIYEREGLIFDVAEVRSSAPSFALLPPDGVFRLSRPRGRPVRLLGAPRPARHRSGRRRNGKLTLALPCERALPVSLARPFYKAFVEAVALS